MQFAHDCTISLLYIRLNDSAPFKPNRYNKNSHDHCQTVMSEPIQSNLKIAVSFGETDMLG